MAIVGLKMVRLALVDPKTQKLIKGNDGLSTDGVIEVDSKMLGTRTANISNLEGQATKVPGNNQTQDVMVAPGSPTVAFDFNNLDFDLKQKLLGFRPDGKGGYTMGGEKPHVAVLIESETLDRKHSVFFGFANGIMQETTQNVATDTDTAQTRQNDNMTSVPCQRMRLVMSLTRNTSLEHLLLIKPTCIKKFLVDMHLQEQA